MIIVNGVRVRPNTSSQRTQHRGFITTRMRYLCALPQSATGSSTRPRTQDRFGSSQPEHATAVHVRTGSRYVPKATTQASTRLGPSQRQLLQATSGLDLIR